MAKVRKVPKDKATGIPKKYLSGVTGRQRTELANVIKRISTLYSQGKNIPQSLINRRIKLGQRKK
tara:strand:- start:1386 stop:1580 length:195 start_codon:yes stop_codon:yes gene_type:complete